jgi:arginyl-tRNA synthetase
VDEDAKVIVRSNGTVTYVGKDIAYHLWKFGLLGRDFGYARFFAYAITCAGSRPKRVRRRIPISAARRPSTTSLTAARPIPRQT